MKSTNKLVKGKKANGKEEAEKRIEVKHNWISAQFRGQIDSKYPEGKKALLNFTVDMIRRDKRDSFNLFVLINIESNRPIAREEKRCIQFWKLVA